MDSEFDLDIQIFSRGSESRSGQEGQGTEANCMTIDVCPTDACYTNGGQVTCNDTCVTCRTCHTCDARDCTVHPA